MMLAPDPAVPHRDELLDGRRVAELLSGRLLDEPVVSCRRQFAKYRVSDGLRVVYRVAADGVERHVAARGFPRGASAAAYHRALSAAVPAPPLRPVVRFFSVYGPRQRPDMAFRRFCEAAAAGAPIEIYGDGRQTRDFTFVGDVVAAVLAAGEGAGDGGAVYNIGGGSRVSLAAALELLAAIAGRPLDVRRRERESGDVQDTGADITRAREALGFEPATDLRTGLQAEFEWVLDHARAGRSAIASTG